VVSRREDVVEVLGLLRVDRPDHLLAQHLGEAEDRVQRGPELVGHVREEVRLVLAGGLQLAALLVELVQRARQIARAFLDLQLEAAV
jgi:hypothetical protein